LSGRDGFGALSPSHRACKARFGVFVEVKRIFCTASEAKKRRLKEVTGVTGRWTGHWIGRDRRVRSVHPACRGSACTGASSRSWDRRVRSSPSEVAKDARSIGRSGASNHDRPDASSREWMLTGNDRTLALWHPVKFCSASGRSMTIGALSRLLRSYACRLKRRTRGRP
jgi:hypothetical protein